MKTLNQLLDSNIDTGTIARGRDYYRQGMVKTWHWASRDDKHGRIEAIVLGSARNRYTQSIDIDFVSGRIEGECTCPVGINCKHVTAVLLEAANEDNASLIATPAPATSSAKPATAANLAKPLSPEIEMWISSLSRAVSTESDNYPVGINERIAYFFVPITDRTTPTVVLDICKVRVLKSGIYSGAASYGSLSNAVAVRPQFVSVRDVKVFRQLLANQGLSYGSGRHFFTGLEAGVIQTMVESGRAFLRTNHPHIDPASAIVWGAPRKGEALWQTLANGDQRPTLITTPPASMILPTMPPTYVDIREGAVPMCGIVETTLDPAIANAIVVAPVMPAAMVARVARELQTRQLHHVITPPDVMPETLLQHFAPTVVLTINTHKEQELSRQTWRYVTSYTDYAKLTFDYKGEIVSGKNPTEIVLIESGSLLRITRNHALEKAARDELRRLGLIAIEQAKAGAKPKKMQGSLVFPNTDVEAVAMARWLEFIEVTVPTLRRAGWRIDIPDDFRFNLTEIDAWYADVDEEQTKTNWFDLEIGIEVDGKKMSLIPILLKLIREAPHEWRMAELKTRSDDEKLIVGVASGVRVALPLGRVKPILTALYELYMHDPANADGKRIRLSTFDAARLAEVDAALQLRWVGGERLLAMGRRLVDFAGIAPATVPKNFQAILRPYQLDGVAWLQFLREYQFAGVLADDMGLGKTVQTLAHLLIEKTAGRMKQPALVVAPTSLMNTWASEAARFAPSLRVLVSHGSDRDRDSTLFTKYDVVLTTYALLNRDEKLLKSLTWHSVILDEAQNIKNPKTKAAIVASTLNADNRLCLSGTPLENHLGELWSLFHFLMPGFLGDEKTFQREFRKPIEKEGALEPRQFLARRIKPFMLRRTKELVAAELPPKTIVTRTVALNAAQADLYETVRAAMDERVRALIAQQGLARSHIVVLDALLKLRQICCDPRLLPESLKGASKAKSLTSAKLELLLEMLDELISEGRSILVFSQFTSMLALIEAALNERKIEYVKLTGETTDRKTPVDSFQSGEVKLFLISLKAGGTGLTLTAADTVIHYDPWWNPAVENQATDRAHRIGQDKPVFVYKLVAEGTVEERIVEMQTRKGALATGILEGDGKAVSAITVEDLQGLFQPLITSEK
jgi:SNF2 family DNA or RNA helicase